MPLSRSLRLKNLAPRYPIVQGGMGVGISLYRLAAAVGREGGIGTLSSAALNQLTARRVGQPGALDPVEATAREVADTKAEAGVCALNIMCAVTGRDQKAYMQAVEGGVRGGVDVIISGAGLPMHLPNQVAQFAGKNHDISLVPIISSARALNILLKRFWDKQGYRPDAIVLEGPKAGGHLGWQHKEVIEAGEDFCKKFDLLDVLLDPVLEVCAQMPNDRGPIPVIVAGGIYTHEDIAEALRRGAAGVQMGTRFAVTAESNGSDEFKAAVVAATEDDVAIAGPDWSSPCGYPFRYLKSSPFLKAAPPPGGDHAFCICTGLLATAGFDNTATMGTPGHPKGCPEGYVKPPGAACPATPAPSVYKGLYTIGANAARIDRVLTVKELMTELVG